MTTLRKYIEDRITFCLEREKVAMGEGKASLANSYGSAALALADVIREMKVRATPRAIDGKSASAGEA